MDTFVAEDQKSGSTSPDENPAVNVPLEDAIAFASEIQPFPCIEEPAKDPLGEQEQASESTSNVLIAPIRRVPTEILLHIFLRFIEPSMDPFECPSQASPIVDVNFYPWLLSHVCHEWREIMFSSSTCWSSVHIRRPSTIDRRIAKRLTEGQCKTISHLLSRQIALSQDQPLQLSVCTNCLTLRELDSKLLDLVLSLPERWQKITIHNRGRWVWSRERHYILQRLFATEGKDYFPLLEEIHTTTQSPLNISPHCRLPRLRRAAFSGSLEPWPENFPWSNLVELSLTIVDEDRIIALLPQLTNLHVLEITYIVAPNGVVNRSTSPINFSSLHTLSVCLNYTAVVRAITTPRLTQLRIGRSKLPPDADRYANETDIASLVDLIRRSSCTVSVFVGRVLTTKSKLCSLLHSLPMLVDLDTIIDDDVKRIQTQTPAHFSDLMQALGDKDVDGNLTICPSLRKIAIMVDWYGHPDTKDGRTSLLDMLEARYTNQIAAKRHLGSIVVGQGEGLLGDVDFMSRAEALKRAGLDISVNSKSLVH